MLWTEQCEISDLGKSQRPTCFARLSRFSLMCLPKRLEKSLDGIDRGRMRWASAAFGCFSQVKVIVWLSCSEFLLRTANIVSSAFPILCCVYCTGQTNSERERSLHLWVNVQHLSLFVFMLTQLCLPCVVGLLPAFSSLSRQPRVSPFKSQTESHQTDWDFQAKRAWRNLIAWVHPQSHVVAFKKCVVCIIRFHETPMHTR